MSQVIRVMNAAELTFVANYINNIYPGIEGAAVTEGRIAAQPAALQQQLLRAVCEEDKNLINWFHNFLV